MGAFVYMKTEEACLGVRQSFYIGNPYFVRALVWEGYCFSCPLCRCIDQVSSELTNRMANHNSEIISLCEALDEVVGAVEAELAGFAEVGDATGVLAEEDVGEATVVVGLG